MSDEAGSSALGRPITLDELVALNDEIVALTRSGMPLESGLVLAGRDLPGRLGAVASALGGRMERGENLPEALDAVGQGLPEVYRSVVRAGLRCGRLSTALEGLATYARGYSEARRSIGLALWYPLLVLTLAYLLFLGILTVVVPRFDSAFETLGVRDHPVNAALSALGRTAIYWGPALPAVLLAFSAGWVLSRRALSLDRGWTFAALRLFPWMGRLLSGFQASSFCELTALLIEHGVPYPEALRLAGAASGDRRLVRSSEALAGSVEAGGTGAEVAAGAGAFPPLLAWVLATGAAQGNLPASLRRMADRYRADARFQGEKMRILLPAVLLFAVGATSTFLYALVIFLPLSTLWTSVAGQVR
ncbi:MAG: type II secretion system F family protein [Isosphaeraceae bacterium]